MFILLLFLVGEILMVIIGGVNCIFDLVSFIMLFLVRMVLLIGKCYMFFENVDGYVCGEGCGIVILKIFKDVIIENLNFIFFLYI